MNKKKIFLNNKLNSLKTNKYAARLTDVFNSSPIANEENFNAAKISYDSTIYVLTTKKKSMKLTISLYILIGTILGIFFVLILNAMQKRR